eukprot:12610-Heterococcus_DN1.PRE.3
MSSSHNLLFELPIVALTHDMWSATVPEDELAMKLFNIQRSATAETSTKSSSSSRADKHKGEYSSDGSRSDSEQRKDSSRRERKKDSKKDAKKDKKRVKQRDSSSTSRDDKHSNKKSGANSSSSRKRSRSVEKEERHHRSERSSERSYRHVDKKQHKSGESHTHKSTSSGSSNSSSRTWLCSSIRVRVVGRAYKGGDNARHYCKKGTIIAVQSGSSSNSSSRSSSIAVATVRMDSGDVLQSVLQCNSPVCLLGVATTCKAASIAKRCLSGVYACDTVAVAHATTCAWGAVKVLRGSSYGNRGVIVAKGGAARDSSSCAVLQRMCLPALLYPNTMLDLQHVQRMMLTLFSSLHARAARAAARAARAAARASNICTNSSSQHKLAEGMASVRLNDAGSTLLTLSLDDIAEVV